MKKWFIILAILILIVGCVPPAPEPEKKAEPEVKEEPQEQEQAPTEEEKEGTTEEELAEPKPKILPKEVTIAFSSTPSGALRGGLINRFVWSIKQENGADVQLTQLQASRSEDFSPLEFTSEPQAGAMGTFSGYLQFKRSTDANYYIRAMADIDDKRYYSKIIEKTVIPTVVKPKSTTTKTVETESGEKREVKVIEIDMENNQFQPNQIEAAIGDILKFTNKDILSHSVTIEDLGIDESARKGETIEITLEKAGSFYIKDKVTHMSAILKVKS